MAAIRGHAASRGQRVAHGRWPQPLGHGLTPHMETSHATQSHTGTGLSSQRSFSETWLESPHSSPEGRGGGPDTGPGIDPGPPPEARSTWPPVHTGESTVAAGEGRGPHLRAGSSGPPSLLLAQDPCVRARGWGHEGVLPQSGNSRRAPPHVPPPAETTVSENRTPFSQSLTGAKELLQGALEAGHDPRTSSVVEKAADSWPPAKSMFLGPARLASLPACRTVSRRAPRSNEVSG